MLPGAQLDQSTAAHVPKYVIARSVAWAFIRLQRVKRTQHRETACVVNVTHTCTGRGLRGAGGEQAHLRPQAKKSMPCPSSCTRMPRATSSGALLMRGETTTVVMLFSAVRDPGVYGTQNAKWRQHSLSTSDAASVPGRGQPTA